ncbi:MAG: hypothetical protein AM326_12485 [Candidatus Thorarchaeota archaeon SMTZ-45]|nr:MAG: hypothetical protein AM326_12485 [Candidatus Thorarchaeota archaeon SMTZ-45]
MTDDYDEMQRKRERARRYLISVAELNQLIVREFKSSTDGFSEQDVVDRFPEHSLQQIRDALESAVEDEYFRVTTRDDGSLWYTPIIYDEWD